jgi:hypothetical protein
MRLRRYSLTEMSRLLPGINITIADGPSPIVKISPSI